MKRSLLYLLFLISGFSSLAQFPEQKLVPEDIDPGDFFGRYVAIQGNDILVGAHQDDQNGYASGSLYAFSRASAGSDFIEMQKILPDDGGVEEFFGYSIDIDGEWASVGSHHDSDFGGSSGGAFALEKTAGQWIIRQKLLPGDPKAGDEFGKATGISSGTIAAGAWLDDDGGTNAGSVYLFRQENDQWVQYQEIRPLDATAYDQFGNFLSIDGRHLAVGVPEKQTVGNKSGCAYVFEKTVTDEWIQQAKIAPGDLAPGDEFGQAIHLTGDRLVVGAYKQDSPAENGGAVYVYQNNGTGWTPVQKIVPADNEPGDHFGNDVAQDENLLAVGAYFDNDNGSKSGSVYIYQWQNGQYEFLAKIITSDGGFGDAFGSSVALDAPLLLSGAYADSDKGFFSGSAYVFDLSTAVSAWEPVTEEIRVFPTLFTDHLTIKMEPDTPFPANLSLWNSSGEPVASWSQEVPVQIIGLSRLSPGWYVLNIQQGKSSKSFRVYKSGS
jgi:hypothetical protein